MEPLFAAALGFLLGSIPFGLILTRAAGLGDVRKIGSGSIGATNVLRTGNKGLAAATVLLDAGKAAAAVLVASVLWNGCEPLSLFGCQPANLREEAAALAAVGAVAGHCFTPWLAFKGGKGFASAAGALAALAWPAMLACAAIWGLTLFLSRISSVSSLVSVVAAPVVAWGLGYSQAIPPLMAIAAIVIVQHRANIGRLMRGEEPKVGSSSARP
ncbi:glycerol-3-phosphate 1-O-acyltransferase PlsY [Porphyrobacter sp. AAP82]|uniref:glycerol-3-phosphate 1-O-acyltransferase PlsY n=1 Tax=Porphyrobacter sp. AAP82 TaxID=1248917 RepID=UPI0002D65629|nr:glycerol-3-phosphate 1-O-acyltransferase PlsY [Porphyrobacter sp. AAP82]